MISEDGGGEAGVLVKLQAEAVPVYKSVLAALAELFSEGMHGITILSGGTDGEDGPTDAAGAVADRTLVKHAQREKINPREFLTRHDAYRFFESLGGLLRTGPTHTNVMDVRVALVEQLHE